MVRRKVPQIDWISTLPGSGEPSSIMTMPERKIGLNPPAPIEPGAGGEVVFIPPADVPDAVPVDVPLPEVPAVPVPLVVVPV
jgi:hypothetical protein